MKVNGNDVKVFNGYMRGKAIDGVSKVALYLVDGWVLLVDTEQLIKAVNDNPNLWLNNHNGIHLKELRRACSRNMERMRLYNKGVFFPAPVGLDWKGVEKLVRHYVGGRVTGGLKNHRADVINGGLKIEVKGRCAWVDGSRPEDDVEVEG